MMNKLAKTLFDILFPFGSFLETVEKRSTNTALLDLFLHVLPLTFFVYWLASFIPYGTLIYIIFFTSFAAQKYINSKSITSERERSYVFLWYFIVLVCGFGALRNFIGHFLLADSVAQSIGWATGSQFQTELAFYHLGLGIAGLIAIWLRKELLVGLAVIKIVFGLGAAYVHIKDIIISNNLSSGNTGVVLVGDILIPVILIILLVEIYRDKSKT